MNTTKKTMVLHGDGVHDDTAALQAYLNGEATLIFPDGSPFDGRGSVCKISRTLQASSDDEISRLNELSGLVSTWSVAR